MEVQQEPMLQLVQHSTLYVYAIYFNGQLYFREMREALKSYMIPALRWDTGKLPMSWSVPPKNPLRVLQYTRKT